MLIQMHGDQVLNIKRGPKVSFQSHIDHLLHVNKIMFW